jgi:thiol:disulfide interchange protein DsbD
MPLNSSYKLLGIILGVAALLAAQQQMTPTLTVAPVPTVKAQKGSVAVVSLRAVLPPGFHANSNTPSDAYLIPLTLKWTGGPLEADGITYPKGAMEKYSFSEKPLSVVTGEFTITTKFKVPANAATGASAQNGTLRYQACNDRMCFAPKTLNVSLALNIE